MYNSYFGFKIRPFQINTDPGFLWLGEKHKEALSVLRYGVMDQRGFLVLTGDAGTGKTTLLNALVEGLPPDVVVARIFDPKLELLDFINIIASSFGINESFKSKGPFLVSFEKFLLEQHYSGKNLLLIIDEAQRLPCDLIDEIRVLSNLEKPDKKLLNVFFAGQNEFNDLLLDTRNRSIRQRITLSYQIEPLNKEEVGEYVRHRQKVAGAQKNFFSKKSLECVYELTGGLPRLINILCDHALLTAYVGNKKLVSDGIVRECARDLEITSFFGQPERETKPANFPANGKQAKAAAEPSKKKKKKWVRAALLLILLFLAAGYSAGRWLQLSDLRLFSAPEGPISQTQRAETADSNGFNRELEEIPPAGSETTPAGFPERGSKDKSAMEQEDLRDMAEEKDMPDKEMVPPVRTGEKDVPAAEMPPVPERLVVYFHKEDYGLDRDAFEVLDKARALLQRNPKLKATVTGFTDSLGEPGLNTKLSELRANIVESYLSGNGIDPERIDSRGMGTGAPASTDQSPPERAMSRRAEILFYYP